MANLATKVILLFLIIAFTFNVTSGIGISCSGSGSVASITTTSMVNDLQDLILKITTDNLVAFGVTAIGFAIGNNLFIFAGLATTFANILTFQQSIINQNLLCLGGDFVSLLSNIFDLLLIFAIIAWFGNKSGEAP